MTGTTASLGQLVVQISMDPSAYQAGSRSLQSSSKTVGQAIGNAGTTGAAAMDKVSVHTAGARKELLVMAHELATGNFKNFGGSLMVFGEQIDAFKLILSPVGLAVTAAAAAVGSFAVAAYKGYEESKAFNNALILTGNYAGLTSSSFEAMAQTLSDRTHTSMGTAREAMIGLVQSGQIGSESMVALGDSAIHMHEVTGQSLEDIQKDYARMPDGVAKWAEQHNASMHFMTTAQYEYVRELEDAGDKQGAMLEVARTLDAHWTSESIPNLGALERAWRGVGDGIRSAWEWMKSIRRDETTSEKIAAASADVSRLKNALNSPTGKMNADLYQGQLNAAQEKLDNLNHEASREQWSAAVKAQEAATQQAGIAASDYIKKLRDEEKGVQRVNDALKEYRQHVAAYNTANPDNKVTAAQQAADEAAIRKRYSDHSGAGAANRLRKSILDAALQETKNDLELITAAYKSQDDQLQALHKATLVSDQAFYQAEISLANETAQKQITAYEREKTTLQDAYWKAPADERIRITKEIGEVDTKIAKVQQDNHAKIAVLMTQETQAQREYLKSIQDAHNALLAQTGVTAPKALTDYDQKYRGAMLQAVTTGDLSGAAFLDQNRLLTDLSARYNDIVAQAKDAQAQISLDQQTGLSGLFDGFSRLRDNSESTVQSLQVLYDQVNRLSWSTTDEGVLRSLDQLRDKIRQSMLDSRGYLQDFTTAGKDAFSGMFSDIVTRSKTPADAVASMVSSMLASFSRLFAERTFSSLMNLIIPSLTSAGLSAVGNAYGFTMPSSISGSGSLYGLGAGMEMPGFTLARAGGGSVWGAGTSTSDSINARLSDGEFVTRASVASRPGVRSFLTAFNNGASLGDAARYAGGLPMLQAPSASTSPPVEVHIHGAPEGTQTTQTTGANGAPRIDVLLPAIDRHIASGILSGRGATAKAMQGQYGLNRAVGANR
ncbi:tail tape measure protein [Burkholderia sp. Bp9017]|uniref:phage tail length tape measure family protein n=1 Tax=unclassified Burkholderia TaxID=2613784 RepID=UPI000F600CBC|nr:MULTISPECIES: phage tail length tape measure family protein [unclassified Burkholderia]RQZ24168.1 tail tape measure protein [Burkholderia sp. Bp9017]RQZ32138.1 tail tape measure protein [Burkholderia sp. Bp9016]